ncbi:MAG: TonB-dependent receptor [Acetobacteraceae bacterium]
MGQVATGAWRHHVTAGIAWQGLEKFLPYDFKTINLGMQNLYRPILPQSWQGSFNTATYHTYHSDQTGFFLSDTLDFSPKWSLLAGLRYSIFGQKSWDAQQVSSSERAHPLTPTVALLYHP